MGALAEAAEKVHSEGPLAELLGAAEKLDRYEYRAISRKTRAFRQLLGYVAECRFWQNEPKSTE